MCSPNGENENLKQGPQKWEQIGIISIKSTDYKSLFLFKHYSKKIAVSKTTKLKKN